MIINIIKEIFFIEIQVIKEIKKKDKSKHASISIIKLHFCKVIWVFKAKLNFFLYLKNILKGLFLFIYLFSALAILLLRRLRKQ